MLLEPTHSFIPQTFIKHTCGYCAMTLRVIGGHNDIDTCVCLAGSLYGVWMFKASPKVPNSPGEQVKYKTLAFALEAPLGSCDYPDGFLLVRWAFLLPPLQEEEEVRGFHFATVDSISTAAPGTVTGPCGQVASLLASRGHRQRNS